MFLVFYLFIFFLVLGRNGFKSHYMTKAILECIKRFAVSKPEYSLSIRIVVFEDVMFQTVLQTADAYMSKKKKVSFKGIYTCKL